MPSSLVNRISGFATISPSMMRQKPGSPGSGLHFGRGSSGCSSPINVSNARIAQSAARVGRRPGARLAPHPELRRPTGRLRIASPILDRATMEDPILEFLRSQARNYRCRVCGSNHKGSQLRKIGNHNNKLIVQVTCGRCRDSFFLHVEFAGSIVNAVEEVTRVAAPSPRDTDEIEGEPLSHDEVLDAHQRLAAFQGKLTELLED